MDIQTLTTFFMCCTIINVAKNRLFLGSFLCARRDVQAETSMLATCFNIARMITLLGGVPELLQRLTARTATYALRVV